MEIKIQDGATYTLIKRVDAAAGQQPYRWVGDNGQEIELTDEEAAGL
ncbi:MULTISPECIES: hypothetical protein [unclassified Arthrobacter]|nr:MULTISPECIES: hypothetical protein [unclassified Arthrobacter]MCC9144987.1 hypothetical protein [Arthrobacter sp. zg-Y919]MDK1276215.1 hypothetical protein [Arthrobacter sp. zg.Y919]MDM7988853.1 hypothetical protein [Arthrobacter sp. zg-Y877]WIB02173.1 hypothetical protein QNO10_09325 [Arthrobacter sp. zg-Y919]